MPRPLYPRGKSPRNPLDMRLGGPRAGLDAVEKSKILSLPGLELQTLGRPARSQSLYRLSYPGTHVTLLYADHRNVAHRSDHLLTNVLPTADAKEKETELVRDIVRVPSENSAFFPLNDCFIKA
jgi:hypothetical protein